MLQDKVVGMLVSIFSVLVRLTFVSAMDADTVDLLTPSKAEGESCGYESCPQIKPSDLNVHIVPNTHFEIGQASTFENHFTGKDDFFDTTVVTVKNSFDHVLQELWENDDRKFTISDIAYFFHWWSKRDHTVRRMVFTLLRQGRLSLVGGGFVIPDEATTSYHALIETFTYALRMINATFLHCGRPLVSWQVHVLGHSREMASLIAQMGFDGHFIAPISFDEHIARMQRQGMEFLWRGSDDIGINSDIYTHILFDGLRAPPGFCFSSRCKDPLVIISDSAVRNDDERAKAFVQSMRYRQSPHYNTSNVLVVMGSPSGYHDARMWFNSIDNLIFAINRMSSKKGKNVNAFYSTPYCYLRAVHEAQPALETKQDDFYPFAGNSNAYGTGLYTTAPPVKLLVREAMQYLQVAKQLQVLAGLYNNDRKFEELQWIFGLFQDHTVITGNMRDYVKKNYIERLFVSTQRSLLIMKQAFNKVRNSPSGTIYYNCPYNISMCNVGDRFLVMYNPLSWPVTMPVRMPSHKAIYRVYNSKGQEIQTSMLVIPDIVRRLPGRVTDTGHELAFIAEDIPPLGFKRQEIQTSMLVIPDIVKRLPGRFTDTGHELVFIAEDIPPLGFKSYFIESRGMGRHARGAENDSENTSKHRKKRSVPNDNETATTMHAHAPQNNGVSNDTDVNNRETQRNTKNNDTKVYNTKSKPENDTNERSNKIMHKNKMNNYLKNNNRMDENQIKRKSKRNNTEIHKINKVIANEHNRKEHNINRKEHNTNRKEHNINRKEHNIDRNEHNINRKEHNIDRNEHNINRKDHNIDRNEHNINRKEHNIDRNEHNINRKEHNIDRNEHNINRNEHNIDRNEHNINRNEHNININEHNIHRKEHNINRKETNLNRKEHNINRKKPNINRNDEGRRSQRAFVEISPENKRSIIKKIRNKGKKYLIVRQADQNINDQPLVSDMESDYEYFDEDLRKHDTTATETSNVTNENDKLDDKKQAPETRIGEALSNLTDTVNKPFVQGGEDDITEKVKKPLEISANPQINAELKKNNKDDITEQIRKTFEMADNPQNDTTGEDYDSNLNYTDNEVTDSEKHNLVSTKDMKELLDEVKIKPYETTDIQDESETKPELRTKHTKNKDYIKIKYVQSKNQNREHSETDKVLEEMRKAANIRLNSRTNDEKQVETEGDNREIDTILSTDKTKETNKKAESSASKNNADFKTTTYTYDYIAQTTKNPANNNNQNETSYVPKKVVADKKIDGRKKFRYDAEDEVQGLYEISRDNFIENKYVKLTLDPKHRKINGMRLSNGVNISLDMQFYYYASDDPDRTYNYKWKHPNEEQKEARKMNREMCTPPGVYLFRSIDNKPVPILDYLDVKVLKTDIVQEVQYHYADYASLTVRLYVDSPVVQTDWVVGPIPFTADTPEYLGTDIFIRYMTDLESEAAFYTDANGRQTIKRIRDMRPTYDHVNKDPVAGNFYPVTSKISIVDEARNIRLSILTDRSQGGASLSDGEVDLMLQRRICTDDQNLLGIFANDTEFGKPIWVRGTHHLYLTKDDHKPNRIFEKKLAKEIHLSPIILNSKSYPYGKKSKDTWSKHVNEYSFLKKKLPIGIHLLTLQEWNEHTLLIRLENYLEKSDVVKTGVKTVIVKDLFKNLLIKTVKETTLAGNIWMKDFMPLLWKKKDRFVKSFNDFYATGKPIEWADDDYSEETEARIDAGIVLKPQQIRTFVCEFDHV